MPTLISLITVSIIALHFYIYINRKKNLKVLMDQLDSPNQTGSLFWGGSITGKYQGRDVLCYSHTKATQLFMNAEVTKNVQLTSKKYIFQCHHSGPWSLKIATIKTAIFIMRDLDCMD